MLQTQLKASLTIKSLKFVVDIGFENNDSSYNYDIDNEEVKIEKITEASRKQRKGRVGRVSIIMLSYVP